MLFQWIFISTTSPKNIEDHVRKFLLYKKNVYGDTRFTEFEDEFLNQHVISISVVDTELVSSDRQVSMYIDLVYVCIYVEIRKIVDFVFLPNFI